MTREASRRGKSAKRKGNTFELRVANMIQETFDAPRELVHRTPLSGGGVERGDIIIKKPLLDKFPFFFECRDRVQWSWANLLKNPKKSLLMKWYIDDAIGKCHASEGVARVPLLVFHKPHDAVYVMFDYYYALEQCKLMEKYKFSWVLTVNTSTILVPEWRFSATGIRVTLFSEFLAAFS